MTLNGTPIFLNQAPMKTLHGNKKMRASDTKKSFFCRFYAKNDIFNAFFKQDRILHNSMHMLSRRSHSSTSSSTSKTSAFTLFELMVVVSIIGVVAALAAPSLADTRADARTNEYANELVRGLRNARSATAGYGRAHLVVFNPAGEGDVTIYRGINNRCSTNNWVGIVGAGCSATSPMCVDRVSNDAFTFGASNYRLSMPAFPAGVQVCFEPTGIMRWRSNNVSRFSADNIDATAVSAQGAFIFSVQRHTTSAGDVGVARRVILPLGGSPRILR